jgi:hypothetical protein
LPARTRPPIIALHVLVALWLSVHAPEATEDSGWLTAEVSGAAACIDPARLRPRAEALLGPGVSPPATFVELSVREDPGATFTVQMRIEAEGERVERSLSGPDCATLGEAIALVIAVHVDPLSVATRLSTREEAAAHAIPPVAEPPQTSTSPEPVPRETTATPPASHDRTPDRARMPRPRLALGVAAMAELGVLPRAAGSLQLDVGVLWPHASVEVAGLVSLGPRASAPNDPAVEGTFRLYAGALRGCGVLGRTRMEAALCGGLELGDLWARGDGLDAPATVHALWLAPTLGVRPRVVLHPRVALGGVIDLLVPLRRHRYGVADVGVVHGVAPIAARFGLALQVRLP